MGVKTRLQMEVKARLHDISYGADGEQRVTFVLDQRVDLSKLKDVWIRLKAVVWHETRSLNANAYFFVLATKIAEKTAQSITEVHNQLIADYGQVEVMEGQLMPIIIRDDINWRRLEGIHVRPTGRRKILDDGKLYQTYLVMRGSHSYDSREMALLIQGTISEAQELGIETATPEEQARMLQLWENARKAS